VSDDVYAGELWVTRHDGERGVLHGNPHTFPGRFSVLWESTGQTHVTSLSDLADMSPQSKVWLAGFLCGNEPEPFEVLGLDSDAELTDQDYELWRRQLHEFRQSGSIYLPIRDDDPDET